MTNGAAGDLESVAAVEEQLRKAQLLPASDPKRLELPKGYSLEAVGSFRNQIEANRRLMWIIPLVIFINLLLIYVEFRNLPISLAVFTGIPVAFAGGMILVAIMDVELNTAVWVGFIALFGLAVDDGVETLGAQGFPELVGARAVATPDVDNPGAFRIASVELPTYCLP